MFLRQYVVNSALSKMRSSHASRPLALMLISNLCISCLVHRGRGSESSSWICLVSLCSCTLVLHFRWGMMVTAVLTVQKNGTVQRSWWSCTQILSSNKWGFGRVVCLWVLFLREIVGSVKSEIWKVCLCGVRMCLSFLCWYVCVAMWLKVHRHILFVLIFSQSKQQWDSGNHSVWNRNWTCSWFIRSNTWMCGAQQFCHIGFLNSK